MKCLVTGAAGFVGSSLVDELLSQGHEVRGIDSFLDYYPEKIKRANLKEALTNSSFEMIEDSLLKTDPVDLLRDVEWVFHQAGQAGVRASWGKYFSTYADNNILASQRLMEACKESNALKKFIYASSSSVYGNAETFPTSENVLPKPVSPYGVTKLAGEHIVSLYASQYGVPALSLRYFTVYGPRQRPDMAFHKFIRGGLKGEEVVVYGDGTQTRDFTFISDVVKANIQAAENGIDGSVLNIGGGNRVALKNVLSVIESITGALNIRYQERQRGDALHTAADVSLARETIGYDPEYSLEQGLREEADWINRCLNDGLL